MRFLKNKKAVVIALSALMAFSLFAAGNKKNAKKSGETITDLISRNVEVVPGSYKRVVCIGAGALRIYSYVVDANLLCGVEDIDNTTLSARPKMFDSVARPYVLAYGDVFKTLPSCGVGGPNAQTAEAEKILSCNPDIVISEYEDVEKEKFVALGSDMDIIIMDAAAVKNIKPLYKEDKTLFDSCKAWNDGEVYLEMAYNA